MLGSNSLKSISGKKKTAAVSVFSFFLAQKLFFRQNALPAQKVLKENPLQIRQLQQLKVGYAQHQNGFTSNSLMYLAGQRLIQTNFRLAAGSQ